MSAWLERLASPALRERLGELERQDAEVRLLKLLLGEFKLFEWALSIGTLRDPVLRSLAPPLPPDALRSITAEDAPELFLWTGLVDIESILRLYHQHQIVAQPGSGSRNGAPRLLDFGCGCGRLLRFLLGHGDLLELHGSDVNPDHVEWCRKFLPGITFVRNAPRPPLPHEPNFFDGIWSLSVFTHLDEDAGAAWRRELARVLAPGGILIATTHGRATLDRIAAGPDLATRFGVAPQPMESLLRRVETEGYAFLPYERKALAAAKAGEEYGVHFATQEHVSRRWADERFALVDYLPGALRGWQDVVVLRRR